MAVRPAPLGEFEQLVLLSILHNDEDAYGVTIRREIERRTQRHVTVGALYTALDRFERKGLVTSTLSAPTARRGGRAKRYFVVTSAGGRALRRSHETLALMWAGLEPNLTRS